VGIVADLLLRWTAVYNSAGSLLPTRKAIQAGDGLEIEDAGNATKIRLGNGLTLQAQSGAPSPPADGYGRLYAGPDAEPRWMSKIAGIGPLSYELVRMVSAVTAVDDVSIPDGDSVSVDVSVPGVYTALGIAVQVTGPLISEGICFHGYVKSSGVVACRYSNFSGGTVEPPNGLVVMYITCLLAS
jgi:hypothetical protein